MNKKTNFIKLLLKVTCIIYLFSSCAHEKKDDDIKFIVKTDKTIGEYVDDFLIKEKITSSIKNSMPKTAPYVNVTVVKGSVKYVGIVTNVNESIKLIELAWSQAGVKSVINYLEVENKNFTFDISQYAKDSWITSSIKIKTLTNKNIKFNNFTIITNNNIVYIFGIARNKLEMEAIAKIAAKTNNVEKVIVNVQLATSEK